MFQPYPSQRDTKAKLNWINKLSLVYQNVSLAVSRGFVSQNKTMGLTGCDNA